MNTRSRPDRRLSLSLLVLLCALSAAFAETVNGTSTAAPTGTATPTGTGAPSGTQPPTVASTAVPTLADSQTSSATQQPTQPQAVPGECFTNTTLLFETIQTASYDQQKEYVICPNTVHNIGYSQGGACCMNGDMPFMPRANTIFKCGESGSSNNSCIIRGGEIHVSNIGLNFGGESTENVIFQGFIFEGAALTNVFANNKGDMTFEDCIFRYNANSAPVLGLYSVSSSVGRRARELQKVGLDPRRAIGMSMNPKYIASLLEKDKGDDYVSPEEEDSVDEYYVSIVRYHEMRSRELQVPDLSILVFNNCSFESNRQGSFDGALVQYGIIYMANQFNELTIAKNTSFWNNSYGYEAGANIGYAVQTQGGKISVYDTCVFDNNQFHGFGAFQAFNGSLFSSSGVYGPPSADLICSFAATSSAMLPTSEADVTCVNYDWTFCPFPTAHTTVDDTGTNGTTNGTATSAPIGTNAPTPSTAPRGTNAPTIISITTNAPTPTPTAAPTRTPTPPKRTPAPTKAPQKPATSGSNNGLGSAKGRSLARLALFTVLVTIYSTYVTWLQC